MLHAIVGARVLPAMVVASCVGVWGLHVYAVQTENPFLGLIQLERPFVFQAVAYAIASLLNNLFAKSKEPFWQQAYTDLLKFVISLRRITDGHTTLAEVYRYISEDGLIDKNIRTLEAQFRDPPPVLVIDAQRCKET